jgi:hypothetical protein
MRDDEKVFRIRKRLFDLIRRFFFATSMLGYITWLTSLNPQIALSQTQQLMKLDETHPILFYIQYLLTIIGMFLATSFVMGVAFYWFAIIYVVAVEFHIIGLQFESFSLGDLTDGTEWQPKIDEFKILIQQYQKLLR